MGRSFLEKMGLVERVQQTDENVVINDNYCFEEDEDLEEQQEVNIEGVSQDNLIADIYSANDLTNMDTSIFKVEEIKATLPTTMTTESMKSTVTGILASFKLTVDELIQDAFDRTEVLRAACAQITADNTTVIDDCKTKIEDAKRLIENLEKDIALREKVIADSIKIINTEVNRIDGLNIFLGGEQND